MRAELIPCLAIVALLCVRGPRWLREAMQAAVLLVLLTLAIVLYARGAHE